MVVTIDLEQRCVDAGLKMTGQRRIILQVLAMSDDHPSVEMVHQRVRELDASVSVATVYRTLNILGEMNLVRRHDFNENYARFETNLNHHHHAINVGSGEVIEFEDKKWDVLIERIAARLGFELVDHKLELYGRKKKK
ncbi:MAG: Fur family transcriptional regulator [Alphaproteobacteria bacterium]